MLTIENIYNFRILERHPGLFINNQRIIGIKPFNDENTWYMVVTSEEMVIANSQKKLKITMIPYRNNEKWS